MANQYIDKTAPWALAKDPEKGPAVEDRFVQFSRKLYDS